MITPFTDKEFADKKAELESLARSIDLWQATPMSDKKAGRIGFLFEELQNNMYAVECEFLELKLKAYREIKDEIKKL